VKTSAFDAHIRQCAPSVYAYARAISRDRWAAEDATQETFLRAWKYIDSYRGRGSFEGWLLRICRRCVIDLASRTGTAPLASAESAMELEHLAAPTTFTADLETMDLLARLPLPQREVVALCGWLGYSYDEVAAMLEIPIGTVRSRLARARVALQQRSLCSEFDYDSSDGRGSSDSSDSRGSGGGGGADIGGAGTRGVQVLAG
jgi:RNA polymerase sigma-70 factor, ECF subfamily